MSDRKLLTKAQLCEELQINRCTLWRWEKKGLPSVRVTPHRVRYCLDEVLAWVKTVTAQVVKEARDR
jgi:predicted DNA-binding transcriptional regulator AlpA